MNREQFIEHAEGIQRGLRRFLTALCAGDSQQADDIAQDALLKAYMTSDSLKDESKFTAWVFRIAYNTFLNGKRSEKRTADYDEARGLAGSERADDAFRYQGLYKALEALPDREKTAVLLFYMEGYQVKEIAEITDASPDAVRQHLSRGRKHLKTILENEQ